MALLIDTHIKIIKNNIGEPKRILQNNLNKRAQNTSKNNNRKKKLKPQKLERKKITLVTMIKKNFNY